ncbi:MAG: hypothetical protein NC452_07630 [Eubacterium sp.]|nr:hypothetical protein [Eubacterium sp.]
MVIDAGITFSGIFVGKSAEAFVISSIAAVPETGGVSLVAAIPAYAAGALADTVVTGTGVILLASDIQGYNSASQAMRDAKMFESNDGLSNAIHAGKPGSQSWSEAKKAIRDGKGKGINVIANSEDDARKLLSEARSELQEFETYTPEKYKAGFEVHPAEPDVGNDLPHLKWKDWSNGKSSGANGHIFWEE